MREQLVAAAALLEKPLAQVNEVARMRCLPEDMRQQADQLSADLAQLQRQLTERAQFLLNMVQMQP